MKFQQTQPTAFFFIIPRPKAHLYARTRRSKINNNINSSRIFRLSRCLGWFYLRLQGANVNLKCNIYDRQTVNQWSALVRTDERTVTWWPNFLGWADYHIFLGMGIRLRAPPHCFHQVQKSWIVSFLCNWWCGEKIEFRWKFFILGGWTTVTIHDHE